MRRDHRTYLCHVNFCFMSLQSWFCQFWEQGLKWFGYVSLVSTTNLAFFYTFNFIAIASLKYSLMVYKTVLQKTDLKSCKCHPHLFKTFLWVQTVQRSWASRNTNRHAMPCSTIWLLISKNYSVQAFWCPRWTISIIIIDNLYPAIGISANQNTGNPLYTWFYYCTQPSHQGSCICFIKGPARTWQI